MRAGEHHNEVVYETFIPCLESGESNLEFWYLLEWATLIANHMLGCQNQNINMIHPYIGDVYGIGRIHSNSVLVRQIDDIMDVERILYLLQCNLKTANPNFKRKAIMEDVVKLLLFIFNYYKPPLNRE